MPNLNTDWISLRMPSGPKRPNLVIVRTGPRSLHTTWLKDRTSSERSWDLLISHFDEASEPHDRDADIIVKQGAFKFSACHRLFQDIPWLTTYEAVWFCDDDIMTSWSDIDRLFHLFSDHHLALAQPALTPDSSTCHSICQQRPHHLLRYTNFIEIMVPLLSQSALQKLLPTFQGAVTGWGLDFVWPNLLKGDQKAIAVIDAVAVRHARASAQGPLYDEIKSLNIKPLEEYHRNLERYDIKETSKYEYGALWLEPISYDYHRSDSGRKIKKLISEASFLLRSQ